MRILDDRKRELAFPRPPTRIVSLVPSDTLSVADLGAGASLVGCTDYCELPEALVAKLPRVGGTKNPRVDDIVALQPDLVLANQEENTRSDLERLIAHGLRVYIAFPRRVADGLAHLARLARILGRTGAPEVRALIKDGYAALQRAEARTAAPIPVFCPIWMKPLMTINGETFISDMLRIAGAQNVFHDRDRRYPLAADLSPTAQAAANVTDRDVRYPRVTLEEVNERAPALVLLPSEPHPFSEEDARVFEDGTRRVLLCDGKDLCWYGSRSVAGIERVRALVQGTSPA